ncbi:hypothetical protein [Tahibacter harae]|uniref:Uncharacterized protein n=1 Tax=Tahibacter harae TaxID=2963937 RepID=A0ABT1QZ93_9GAMM|nr:hypothetical protein [Tahibacter harae]MCQ4167609.1 hypothetical protein [Tahibacter harae]
MKDFIEMNQRGEFPIWMLVAYTVKGLSESGVQADFDSLPIWLKISIREAIATYRDTRMWVVIRSNSEGEDYSPYAEEVIRKFDLNR